MSECRSIFIGGLPYSATVDQITEFFEKYGVESVKINKYRARPSGTAIVFFQTAESAHLAMVEQDKEDFGGRYLSIRMDKKGGDAAPAAAAAAVVLEEKTETVEKKPVVEKKKIEKATTAEGSSTVFIANLAWATSGKTLASTLGEYGTVDRVSLPRYPDGRKKGFAYVQFSTPEEAQACIAGVTENPVTIDGRELRFDIDVAK